MVGINSVELVVKGCAVPDQWVIYIGTSNKPFITSSLPASARLYIYHPCRQCINENWHSQEVSTLGLFLARFVL